MTTYRISPTTEDAANARNEAALMGYKVRVRRGRFALHLVGAVGEVRDLCVLLGLANACGEPATLAGVVPNYNGSTEFDAYRFVTK